MSQILICGLINLETTLRVDAFPIDYFPVRYPFFSVNSTVSGVGYNIAKALTVLGDQVQFLSMTGTDLAGKMIREAARESRIPGNLILDRLSQTPQSVILYDPHGRRQIHVDLKDIQEQVYPEDLFTQALQACSLAVLCNINFSRPFLDKARQAGKRIASDVHAISSLDDEYNRDFMQAANILFMSDERLPQSAEAWVRSIWDRYGTEIVVVGLGAEGALLGVCSLGSLERIPAVYTRPVVNTIGAGDALFSSFIHEFQKSGDAYAAIHRAVVFASYKIGETGAAEGFLDEAQLDRWCKSVN